MWENYRKGGDDHAYRDLCDILSGIPQGKVEAFMQKEVVRIDLILRDILRWDFKVHSSRVPIAGSNDNYSSSKCR